MSDESSDCYSSDLPCSVLNDGCTLNTSLFDSFQLIYLTVHLAHERLHLESYLGRHDEAIVVQDWHDDRMDLLLYWRDGAENPENR